MTKNKLINNLGSIAKSLTAAAGDIQFGVGFYSGYFVIEGTSPSPTQIRLRVSPISTSRSTLTKPTPPSTVGLA